MATISMVGPAIAISAVLISVEETAVVVEIDSVFERDFGPYGFMNAHRTGRRTAVGSVSGDKDGGSGNHRVNDPLFAMGDEV